MWTVKAASLLLIVCCCSLVHCLETQNKQVIHLLSLLPYYNTDSSINPSLDEGQNIQPALELAQDQINNNSTLLQNYTLNLIFAEDGCTILSTTTTSFVMEAFSTRGRFTGILGPLCSASTLALSTLTNRTELSMVMLHGAGTSLLEDRTRYPNLLGTLGSIRGFVQALLDLMERAKWKRVAVLFDDSRVFYLTIKRNLLQQVPNDTRVELLTPVSLTFIPLAAFEQSRLRIALVLCPAPLAREILCLAYNRSHIYRANQWVIVGHELEVLLKPMEFDFDGTEYRCSKSNMATALEMSILVSYSLVATMSASNTTYEEFLRDYAEYREIYNRRDIRARARNSTYTFWSTYVYDSVWAWAFVLDNLTRTQESFEVGAEYGNQQQSEMIVEQFYKTRFQGISGEINFERDTGYTDRAVDMNQIRNGIGHKIESIGDQNGTEVIFIVDTFLSTVRVNRVLSIFTACVVVIQILVVVALQAITVIYWKKPSIKASSRKLLHISYVGIYMIGLGLFLYFLFLGARFPTRVRRYFCQLLWTWCLPIGFMLTIAAVAMRTWRVYRIFKHYLNPGPLISDPILIGGLFLLLLPILVVSITWTAIDPFREKEFGDRPSDGMVSVKEGCDCTHYNVWLGVILTYLTTVLILLSIFSLLTRNISNQSFATTALRVLSYIMTISFLLGFPLFYFLTYFQFNPDASTAVFAIHINFTMAVVTACVFVPPVLPILRNFKQRVRKISMTSGSNLISPSAIPGRSLAMRRNSRTII